MKNSALPEFGCSSCFVADPEVRRPLVSARAVVPEGSYCPQWVCFRLFARNGCVLGCLPFVGNVRAIMFNERGTVNDGVMFLSVARTPALEKGGM
jgi:hypothetical protein